MAAAEYRQLTARLAAAEGARAEREASFEAARARLEECRDALGHAAEHAHKADEAAVAAARASAAESAARARAAASVAMDHAIADAEERERKLVKEVSAAAATSAEHAKLIDALAHSQDALAVRRHLPPLAPS